MKHRTAGYTLIEVLVASMVLAVAAFGLMGLLRASDQMGYRGRINGVVSTLITTRAGQLVSIPFSQIRAACVDAGGGEDGSVTEFQRGVTGAPNFFTFPFLIPGEGGVDSINYLAMGKPLPGTTLPRGLFPFAEFVTVTFSAGGESATVRYVITWTDSMTGADGDNFDFTFTKYDPLRF